MDFEVFLEQAPFSSKEPILMAHAKRSLGVDQKGLVINLCSIFAFFASYFYFCLLTGVFAIVFSVLALLLVFNDGKVRDLVVFLQLFKVYGPPRWPSAFLIWVMHSNTDKY